jgi:hypothetical protein
MGPSGTSSSGFSTLAPGVSSKRYTQSQTGLAPFPFRWNARLTYGVNVAIGTSGSIPTATRYRFRLNSLYDPDWTATGNQPYQYDQMTAIYRRYIVRKAYVDLTFNNPTSPGMWVGWCIHTATNTQDDPTGKTLEDMISRPNFTVVPITTQGPQAVTLRVQIPLPEVFGLSPGQYMNVTDQYGADSTSNPLSEAYIDLFLVDPNSLVAAQYVRVAGRLVYDCQFFDYVAPNAS